MQTPTTILTALSILPILLAFSLLACGEDEDVDGTPAAVETAVRGQGGADQTPSPGTPAAQQGPVVSDPALRLDRVEGLNQPTQIVFLGPDDLLVAEKTGDIVRVRSGRVEGQVAELSANYADERGVLGLTLHPAFATNRWVYVYWTWTGEGTEPAGLFGNPSEDIEKVPALGNRVDRFIWDGSRLNFDRNIVQLPSRITDLTLNRRRGNHNAGVIDFGPDGKLYVVNGDQNGRGHLQNVIERPELTGPEALQGVVLRLNDDGSIPEDNPFVSLGDDRAKIFIYGLRNSFGYDWDPQSDEFWLQVNGQASFDEIGRYQAGDNVGWVQIMGPPERFQEYKELELNTERLLDNPAFPPSRLASSANEALQRLFMLPGASYRPPVFAWKFAVAPAGLHVIDGGGLGPDYDCDMLVGDVNTGSIYRFQFADNRMNLELRGGLSDGVNDNSSDDPIGEMRDSLFATGIPVATDIETGPDGSLWIASLGGSALFRVTRP